jgi:hypothetical protein
MPTWGEILHELQAPVLELRKQIASGKAPPNTQIAVNFDGVRRKYLRRLFENTGRSVILYASSWTSPRPGLNAELTSITPEDVQGLMEVMHSLPAGRLDLILHSPGGSPEAAEAMVSYLRTRFTDIRVIVPHAAMSAATMVACSANTIVMGKHSFLGPIDPQFVVRTELGVMAVPAHAIIAQFDLAKKECAANPSVIPAWLPMLKQYGPALLVQCELARDLSQSLVSQWLNRYMFAGDKHAASKAEAIADQLARHDAFKSHSRFINRQDAKNLGLNIDDLESEQNFQDAVLSVFHAVSHTFSGTATVKIIENHLGKAFIKAQQMIAVQQPLVPQPIPLPKPPATQ